MSKELEKKIDKLAEFAKQNRIVELKMKIRNTKNERLKKQLEQMVKNLEKN